MALTATATQPMVDEISQTMRSDLNALGLTVVQAPFFRSNLHLSVLPKQRGGAGTDQLIRFVKAKVELKEAGIVYVRTRHDVDLWTAKLQACGISVYGFHAGHTDEHKQRVLAWWTSGKNGVVVATVAFGMGIHRADVRFVVHWCVPGNLLSYFQEIGRAGRDRMYAECVLFYSRDDVELIRDCLHSSRGSAQDRSEFRAMVHWCANRTCCRHFQLLSHFSTPPMRQCGGMCDLCKAE